MNAYELYIAGAALAAMVLWVVDIRRTRKHARRLETALESAQKDAEQYHQCFVDMARREADADSARRAARNSMLVTMEERDSLARKVSELQDALEISRVSEAGMTAAWHSACDKNIAALADVVKMTGLWKQAAELERKYRNLYEKADDRVIKLQGDLDHNAKTIAGLIEELDELKSDLTHLSDANVELAQESHELRQLTDFFAGAICDSGFDLTFDAFEDEQGVTRVRNPKLVKPKSKSLLRKPAKVSPPKKPSPVVNKPRGLA